ncbi:MAG: DUF1579 domain-containing protein [Acidobacteria bacterium]|nr:DUF1579 domain-containing protein [Acidobacteriota bacterium]
MQKKLCVMAFMAFLMCAGAAIAQEEEAAMSAEEMAMMQAFEKAGTPGEQHARLAKMAGEWKVAGKFWMEPGDPVVSEGTSSRRMMLDGRVLAESFTSEFMGVPFAGHGMTGYDNVTGKWWTTWNDSMSTGILTMEGQCTESGDVCTWIGSNIDPMTGKTMYTKMVGRSRNDRETIESWVIGPDGKETRTMELVYTRKKE